MKREALFPQINTIGAFVPTHRHKKSNHEYMWLLNASVEADMSHVVVYVNFRGETFTRPAAEFYERFEEIKNV